LGTNADNVVLQLVSSDSKIAIMPGYTRPAYYNLKSLLLNNGIQIRVGVAYLEEP
jgi:hypothetical protein